MLHLLGSSLTARHGGAKHRDRHAGVLDGRGNHGEHGDHGVQPLAPGDFPKDFQTKPFGSLGFSGYIDFIRLPNAGEIPPVQASTHGACHGQVGSIPAKWDDRPALTTLIYF